MFPITGNAQIKVLMANKHLWATPLSAETSAAREQLGILRREWNSTDSCFKTYRYIQAASDTTVADGTVLGFRDKLRQVASSDASSNDYDENQVLGVGIGVITASYYGWVQTGGYHSAVKTDGDDNIVDGDSIRIHDSTDGVCDRENAGNTGNTPLGIAVADDVPANTVAAYLTINEIGP